MSMQSYYTVTLYGTLGCHLCEKAMQVLNEVALVVPLSITSIDIADLPQADMHALAHVIPVLMYRQKQLNWPFGVLDVNQVLT